MEIKPRPRPHRPYSTIGNRTLPKNEDLNSTVLIKYNKILSEYFF